MFGYFMIDLSWLGSEANLGSIGALYNLTMDPFEKYDMVFNGAAPTRVLSSSPGKYSGQDNGWVLSLIYPPIIDLVLRRVEVLPCDVHPGFLGIAANVGACPQESLAIDVDP